MNKLNRQKPDYIISLIVFALIAFGLVMIYSVSKYYSLQITENGSDKYFFTKQLISASMSIVVWIVFQLIDYRFWQKSASFMFFLTLILLLMPIFFSGSGERWITLLGFQFQPAEMAKLTFIFYLAAWFASRADKIKEIRKMFLPFSGVVGAIAFLMLVQKDLGTLSIFVFIAAVVFVMAGSSLLHLTAAAGFGSFLLWLAVKLEPYRLERITTFLNPEKNLLDTGYHIRNALIAIGSGGLLGLGFGQSRQKYLYLPETHTDSIFAIIAEELGFLRSGVIIILFMIIAVRGYKIAAQSPDVFARLAAVGITAWISAQAFINIAAMLSLVPLTGIPLPFISYGGSSLIFLMAGVGVLMNISKQRSR